MTDGILIDIGEVCLDVGSTEAGNEGDDRGEGGDVDRKLVGAAVEADELHVAGGIDAEVDNDAGVGVGRVDVDGIDDRDAEMEIFERNSDGAFVGAAALAAAIAVTKEVLVTAGNLAELGLKEVFLRDGREACNVNAAGVGIGDGVREDRRTGIAVSAVGCGKCHEILPLSMKNKFVRTCISIT